MLSTVLLFGIERSSIEGTLRKCYASLNGVPTFWNSACELTFPHTGQADRYGVVEVERVRSGHLAYQRQPTSTHANSVRGANNVAR